MGGFRKERCESAPFFCPKMQRQKLGNISVNEAGRRGGLAVLAKHGKKHFSQIGKIGQAILKKRYPGMASEWGKKGGRPRKNKEEEIKNLDVAEMIAMGMGL